MRQGGKPKEGDATPNVLFGRRLADVRRAQGLTQAELAKRLAVNGYTIHRTRLARLEAAEVQATLEDVLALAYVLNVAPVHLMVPIDDLGDVPRMIVVGEAQPASPVEAREWIRGDAVWTTGQSERLFRLQRPRGELADQFAELDPVTQKQIVDQAIATYTREEE